MGRVLLAGILAVTLELITLAGPGSAATSCGGHVTVTGPVPCYKARSIVTEFKKTRKHQIQGFKCGGSLRSGRITAVTCREPGKKIHWKA